MLRASVTFPLLHFFISSVVFESESKLSEQVGGEIPAVG